MYFVSSDGNTIEYISRRGVKRSYTTEQWDKIWPCIFNMIINEYNSLYSKNNKT